MGIKQLYKDNLWNLPSEYGDVSVMYSRVSHEGSIYLLYDKSVVFMLFLLSILNILLNKTHFIEIILLSG